MKRRDFITLLGGAATWPLAARAQQPAMPVIGYLSGRSVEAEAPMLSAFREGLAQVGYVEGRNLEIQYRFADGDVARLQALAVELVSQLPALVVAVTTAGSIAAAAAADAKIPVVFNAGFDPAQIGLVASYSRPGGNMTGAYSVNEELTGKMLGVLHDLVPKAMTIALLQSTGIPDLILNSQRSGARPAAAALGVRLLELRAGTDREIDEAIASMVEQHAEALLVPTEPFFITRARRIADLVARYSLPAIYGRRNFAAAGGLISYGDNVTESYRQIGIYAGRILRGEKAGDLPVVQTTKLELVINLKTAKALGLAVPPTLLAIADEVIE
jgi:putative ABC transport system substrate-binding protein